MENLKIKSDLFKAINSFINKGAEIGNLDGFYYHPELSEQMTEAAFLVLKTAIKNQEYYIKENY